MAITPGRQFKLYHGSPDTTLQPGDIIKPKNPLAQNDSTTAPSVANATTNRDLANAFSNGGSVYEVRPVSMSDAIKTTISQRSSSPWKGQVVSTKGFKVVGVSPKTPEDSTPKDLVKFMKKRKK